MRMRVSVCYGHSHVWTVWYMTLIFCMRVDLDLGYPGIVGQGQTVKIVYTPLFEPVVRSRSILELGLPSSANGNCEWPLPVHWNCLFVSNQGAFNVSLVSGRSALICLTSCSQRQEDERRRQHNMEVMEARRHEDLLRRQRQRADEDPFGNSMVCTYFSCLSVIWSITSEKGEFWCNVTLSLELNFWST